MTPDENNADQQGNLEEKVLAVLRQTFGYESFRPHQADIVAAALAGRGHDVGLVGPEALVAKRLA